MITHDRLIKLVVYDPDTGVFKGSASRRNNKGKPTGSRDRVGFIRIRLSDRESPTAHDLAWLYMTGKWPVGRIYHINMVRDDNRWENLAEFIYDDELTADSVRKLLDYNPDTGVFMWKIPCGGRGFGSPITTVSAGSYSIKINGVNYRAHRLAWLYMTGKWPDLQVDHRNCDPFDNRWKNLREATPADNSANTRVRRFGLKGAYRHGKNGWCSTIRRHGVTYCLGTYKTEEEAHAAYVRKAIELCGEFARAA